MPSDSPTKDDNSWLPELRCHLVEDLARGGQQFDTQPCEVRGSDKSPHPIDGGAETIDPPPQTPVDALHDPEQVNCIIVCVLAARVCV